MGKNNRFLYVTGGCGFVVVLVYAILVLPVQGEVNSLREDQEALKKKIEGDLNSSEYHGEVDLKRVQQEVAALEDALSSLKKTLDLHVDPKFVLEAESSNPFLKFKGALEETRTALVKRAGGLDIPIPTTFGFPEGEIDKAEIPSLMRRLDVMAFTLGKALDAGVKAVTLVAPSGIDENSSGKNRLVTREAVTIELQGSFDAVIRLLHSLNLPSDFVGMERVGIESAATEGDQIKVSLIVAGLEVHPEVELEVKTGGGKPTGGRPWVPGR